MPHGLSTVCSQTIMGAPAHTQPTPSLHHYRLRQHVHRCKTGCDQAQGCGNLCALFVLLGKPSASCSSDTSLSRVGLGVIAQLQEEGLRFMIKP